MWRGLLACAVIAGVAVGFAEARRRKPAAKAPVVTAGAVSKAVAERMASVKKTEALTLDRLDKRTAQVRRRVRSLYKLLRAGPAALWVEPAERSLTVRRRAAASRILRRDFRELALLREELAAVQTARERLSEDRSALATLVWPERRSLVSPVDGRIRVAAPFGDYSRKKPHRLALTRRGLALRVKTGARVSAVAGGRVRYVGAIRGLGTTAIIEHAGFTSVLGPLTKVRVRKLQTVREGAVLGTTAGDRLYMEVRLAIGAGGFPIDPAPLLRRQ
jgi:septal ring factor EnvC (AmiA/AmiB activator)